MKENFTIDELREMVGEVNSWNRELDYLDYQENDEEFFNIYFYNKPDEAVRATYYGDYNYMDDYVRFNAYGNLESCSELEFEKELEYEEEKDIDVQNFERIDGYKNIIIELEYALNISK